MQFYVVLEKLSDRILLERLLPEDIRQAAKFVVTNESVGGSMSVARTLLSKHRKPLVLLYNTKSVDPDTIQDTFGTVDYMVKIAAAGVRWKVIRAIPELEVVFFESGIDLKRLFPQCPDLLLNFARPSPKMALSWLFENGGGPSELAAFLKRLTPEDLERLQANLPVSEVIEFANEVMAVPAR
jgi:hypothetical protein